MFAIQNIPQQIFLPQRSMPPHQQQHMMHKVSQPEVMLSSERIFTDAYPNLQGNPQVNVGKRTHSPSPVQHVQGYYKQPNLNNQPYALPQSKYYHPRSLAYRTALSGPVSEPETRRRSRSWHARSTRRSTLRGLMLSLAQTRLCTAVTRFVVQYSAANGLNVLITSFVSSPQSQFSSWSVNLSVHKPSLTHLLEGFAAANTRVLWINCRPLLFCVYYKNKNLYHYDNRLCWCVFRIILASSHQMPLLGRCVNKMRLRTTNALFGCPLIWCNAPTCFLRFILFPFLSFSLFSIYFPPSSLYTPVWFCLIVAHSFPIRGIKWSIFE